MHETIMIRAEDGAEIEADLYSGGARAVLCAHGKVFDKESWRELAAVLQAAGFTVLALNFRGYGRSTGPDGPQGFAEDIAGCVAALRDRGADAVSIIGGSMGAVAAVDAVASRLATGIDVLILLSPRVLTAPEKLAASHVAMVLSEDEPGADAMKAGYAAMTADKSLMVFAGDHHAQHLFASDHGAALIDHILRTLGPSDPSLAR